MVVIVSLMHVLKSQVLVESMEVCKGIMVMQVLMGRGQVPPLVPLSGEPVVDHVGMAMRVRHRSVLV